MAEADEDLICLCETCCTDHIRTIFESYQGAADAHSVLIGDIRRRDMLSVASVEYMSASRMPSFVSAGGADALLGLAALPAAADGRISYIALRSAFAIVYALPQSDNRSTYDARVAFATGVAAMLRDCDRGRLPDRPATFKGILCCTLEALWPRVVFEKLDLLQSTSIIGLGETGYRLRDVLFETILPARVIFQNLFAIVTKPRAFCQTEKAFLPESQCLHNHALLVLCRLVVGSPPGKHHHVLREVPSALSVLVSIIRDQSAPSSIVCYSVCILRELLQDEDGSVKTVRELLRLAPDVFQV
jgi:hypothetical protein